MQKYLIVLSSLFITFFFYSQIKSDSLYNSAGEYSTKIGKSKNMFNYINSWKSRKSEKWNIEIRLGRITLLQLNYDAKKAKFRFMLLNFGLEIGGK